MGMDRPGIKPGPSRMLCGCDATTPTAPELEGRECSNTCWPQLSALKLCHSQPVRSLLRRGRAPNVAFESNMQQGYRSRGSGQPQKLRFPRWSRPHSFVHSEHQPKGVRRQQGLFSSFLLPAHSFGWCSLWTNECGLEQRGQRSFCSWPLSLDT